METGPDYKVAAGFLFFSVLFFFAALTSLPMILLSPASFNLYFCFGSMFLQIALAFFYAPMVYLRKLFSPETRVISAIYIFSLLLSLYLGWSGAGYISSLVMIGLQAFALAGMVMQAFSGAETANSWMYNMVAANAVNRAKNLFSREKGYDQLPI